MKRIALSAILGVVLGAMLLKPLYQKRNIRWRTNFVQAWQEQQNATS